MDKDQTLSSEEVEILQEIMNIAFGKASADLAEVINVQVGLTVPDVKLVPISKLEEFLKHDLKDYPKISLVKQEFWGDFKGISFLIFSFGSGKELINILQPDNTTLENEPIIELEKETLLEVGNILIGACIGKIAELLGDVVTYSPPNVVVEQKKSENILMHDSKKGDVAILLRTVFDFGERDVNGTLFLITSNDSITWLKKALNDFLENYA